MRIGVVSIPGGDENIVEVMKSYFHNEVSIIPFHRPAFENVELVVLPSNELYCQNDGLRQRVANSSLSQELFSYYSNNGFIIGLQSGFDILCRSGLLCGQFSISSINPFVNAAVNVVAESRRSALTFLIDSDKPLKLFLSHSLGGLKLAADDLHQLKINAQVLLRYSDDDGFLSMMSCPDGSTEGIAAICNSKRNVFGVVPNLAIPYFHQKSLDGIELLGNFLKMITR